MRLKLLILGIVIILAVAAGAGMLGFRQLNQAHTHPSRDKLIVIEPGMGRRAIVDRLVEAGIIENRWPALIYLALRPQESKLQAGDYRFDSPISPIEALRKIHLGQIATEQVTIPEGFDKFDVVNVLAGTTIDSRENFQKAILDTALIADIDPDARNLEGYLFPDTYSYTSQTSASQLVNQMVKRTRQVLTPERQQRARELGLSMRQLLTMASLIEKEARLDQERATIAAVFYNRIKKGMRLDCDPTFMYAAKLEGVWDGNVNNPLHRKRESPYNTYYAVGLPPGPIASPGLKSIEAALNPAQADYIYFVANGTDGSHKFSRTESEHLAAVAAYRKAIQSRN